MSDPSSASRFVLDPRLSRPGNRVRLLRGGEQAYPMMLDDIRAARSLILFEMYIFADDATGRRFADALAERAKAGVTVRIIYDSLGCLGTPARFFAELEAAGCQVLEFHPVRPWARRFSLARRDHRKVLVVDGSRGYVGGINVSLDYDSPQAGGKGWRDSVIRIDGPAVADLTSLFFRTWLRQTRRAATPDPPPVPDPYTDGIPVQILGGDRWLQRRTIASAYLFALRAARHRIWISNAYFVPTPKFVRALRRAALRGVDVRILVPDNPDVHVIYHATRAYFASLLRAGVRIFEWKGTLHSKTAVIDAAWCTVGSYNLDHLSIFRNFEVTASTVDDRLGAAMEAEFELDLANAKEVKYYDWRRRPVGRRILEWFFSLFRGLM